LYSSRQGYTVTLAERRPEPFDYASG